MKKTKKFMWDVLIIVSLLGAVSVTGSRLLSIIFVSMLGLSAWQGGYFKTQRKVDKPTKNNPYGAYDLYDKVG